MNSGAILCTLLAVSSGVSQVEGRSFFYWLFDEIFPHKHSSPTPIVAPAPTPILEAQTVLDLPLDLDTGAYGDLYDGFYGSPSLIDTHIEDESAHIVQKDEPVSVYGSYGVYGSTERATSRRERRPRRAGPSTTTTVTVSSDITHDGLYGAGTYGTYGYGQDSGVYGAVHHSSHKKSHHMS